MSGTQLAGGASAESVIGSRTAALGVTHPGLDANENGLWRQEAALTLVRTTFEPDCFRSRALQAMINFRVHDLGSDARTTARLGVDPSGARKHFPELSRAVGARAFEARTKRTRDRARALRSEVRATAEALQASDIHPSRRKVEARLPHLSLREPALGAAWREARDRVREAGEGPVTKSTAPRAKALRAKGTR